MHIPTKKLTTIWLWITWYHVKNTPQNWGCVGTPSIFVGPFLQKLPWSYFYVKYSRYHQVMHKCVNNEFVSIKHFSIQLCLRANEPYWVIFFHNYTVRKSFREFQKSVFIHELLHKIFCKEGLNISEILWAFRICATSKCQTNNKVYGRL